MKIWMDFDQAGTAASLGCVGGDFEDLDLILKVTRGLKMLKNVLFLS